MDIEKFKEKNTHIESWGLFSLPKNIEHLNKYVKLIEDAKWKDGEHLSYSPFNFHVFNMLVIKDFKVIKIYWINEEIQFDELIPDVEKSWIKIN